jgi:aryl-alcohol dehydrogenase-like predicted oxidoreductase
MLKSKRSSIALEKRLVMQIERHASALKGLVLGTAQLGMPYGIANRSGQPDEAACRDIIAAAWDAGVRTYDTAQAYGTSEQVLGRILDLLSIGEEARIITKLDPRLDYDRPETLKAALERSVRHLGDRPLWGLLLHGDRFLDRWEQGLGRIMAGFIGSGRVRSVGISVYTTGAAAAALELEGLDALQVPASLVDHRFEEEGIFERARILGKTIYIRSVFLQGLLFLHPGHLPPGMEFAAKTLERLQVMVGNSGRSLQELTFGYLQRRFPGCPVLFGAENAAQVLETSQSWETSLTDAEVECIHRTFRHVDDRILTPSLWPPLLERQPC